MKNLPRPATILGAITIAATLTAGICELEFERTHGRRPITGCLAKDLVTGPTYSKEHLGQLHLADVRLGTDATTAMQLVASSGLNGSISAPVYRPGVSAVLISDGMDERTSNLKVRDLSQLGRKLINNSASYNLRYSVGSTSYKSKNVVTSLLVDGKLNAQENLKRSVNMFIGSPTYAYSSWGDCGEADWFIFGSDDILKDPNFSSAISCADFIPKSFYVMCRRNKIPRSTWVAIKVSHGYFSISLIDGDTRYINKFGMY